MKNYMQFFTSIELGDYESVYCHLNSGLDPMREYKMDGKMTNPLRSTLKKGNSEIANLLLDSRKVKVSLQDVLMTPKNVHLEDSTVNKLALHIDFPELNKIDEDTLDSSLKAFVKSNKLSSAHVNYELGKKVLIRRLSRNNTSDREADEEDDGEEDEDDEASDSVSSDANDSESDEDDADDEE